MFTLAIGLQVVGLFASYRFSDGREWPNFICGGLWGAGVALLIEYLL